MPVRKDSPLPDMASVIGALPYRMAFAGGWIDQPFVSRLNPEPPGSMVVVSVEPEFRFMDRCGMATSTREAARRLWGVKLPDRNPSELMRTLYESENEGQAEPSGSQDMAGLIYPGINRLDYDIRYEQGLYPAHVESCNDPDIVHWLEGVIHILPVGPRPDGYSPLGCRNLDPEWIGRLGRTGKECYQAVLSRDTAALGRSFNECMECWQFLLPFTVRHGLLRVDLLSLLRWYQSKYPGAMYSGCGGGYLYVVSDSPVAGSFGVTVRYKRG